MASPREEPFARSIDCNVELQRTSTSKLFRRRLESGKRSIGAPNIRHPSVGVRFYFRRGIIVSPIHVARGYMRFSCLWTIDSVPYKKMLTLYVTYVTYVMCILYGNISIRRYMIKLVFRLAREFDREKSDLFNGK